MATLICCLSWAPLAGAWFPLGNLSPLCQSPLCHQAPHTSREVANLGRRAALGVLAAFPMPALAMVGSTNPANSAPALKTSSIAHVYPCSRMPALTDVVCAAGADYYFPMAKYRYLPRIQRAFIACDQLGGPALAAGDWEGLVTVYERMDDAITAMPLYTNAVEGSRSSKRKKKSGVQKTMLAAAKAYTAACVKLEKAVAKRDSDGVKAALAAASESLGEYRTLAKIDDADGGVIDPAEFASKSGSKVTGTGYVVPVFRGGATGVGLSQDDYALR